MSSKFAVFILTHGRPGKVVTYNSLRNAGYTGRVYIVIDDEDATAPEYHKAFGDMVLTFSKADIAATFDEGDNTGDRRSIVYARNACFDLAKAVGVTHFMQLDDDYSGFYYRFNEDLRYANIQIKSIDRFLELMCEYFDAIPAKSIAMSQGGDHLGGQQGTLNKTIRTRRKCMNTFICRTDRPFQFVGRINEDVNTYTEAQRRGSLFLTLMQPMIVQKQTQANSGGMTDLYLDSGTYVKSFYSVMYCPSAVVIRDMGPSHRRLHHRVIWKNAAPMILHERHRKADA